MTILDEPGNGPATSEPPDRTPLVDADEVNGVAEVLTEPPGGSSIPVRPWQLWLATASHWPSTRREALMVQATAWCMVLTAGLAVLSMTTFTHDLYRMPLLAAFVAGILWSAAIVTLDRKIMHSLSSSTAGRRRFVTVGFRLCVACLIGYLISQGLILRLFNSEITTEIRNYNAAQLAYQLNVINSNPDYGTAAITRDQQLVASTAAQAGTTGATSATVANDPLVKQASAAVAAQQALVDQKREQIAQEATGIAGTHQFGYGPVAQLEQSQLQAMLTDLAAVQATYQQAVAAAEQQSAQTNAEVASVAQPELATYKAQLDAALGSHTTQVAATQALYKGDGTLLAHIDALDRLKARDWTIWKEFWLITLVLTTLDSGAVALKIFDKPMLAETIEARNQQSALVKDDMKRVAEIEELGHWLTTHKENGVAEHRAWFHRNEEVREARAEQHRRDTDVRFNTEAPNRTSPAGLDPAAGAKGPHQPAPRAQAEAPPAMDVDQLVLFDHDHCRQAVAVR